MSKQFGHRYAGVDRLARLHLANPLSERFMEGRTFVGIHVVRGRRDKLDLFAFGRLSLRRAVFARRA